MVSNEKTTSALRGASDFEDVLFGALVGAEVFGGGAVLGFGDDFLVVLAAEN